MKGVSISFNNSYMEGGAQSKCAQFNLGKMKPVNIQINEWLSKQQEGLALFQEPNQKKGKIMLNSEVHRWTGTKGMYINK